MADSGVPPIITELILDLDKFKTKLTEARDLADKGGGEAGDKAGKSLVKQFEEMKAPFLAAAAAVAGAAAVIFGSIKLTSIAEEANRVDEQFGLLTKRAGLMGDELKAGLMKAAGGLVDDTDLIKLANQAMVDLGTNTRRLPELMVLARKATALFGGDLVENLERIKQAVVTGNERQLKQLGLTVDLQKAYRDYAKSIGVATEDLSEHQKQAIALNLILERGKTAFEGVNSSMGANHDAIQRLKVEWSGFVEWAAKIFTSALTPIFEGIANGMVSILRQIKAVVMTGGIQGAPAAEVGRDPAASDPRVDGEHNANAAIEAERDRHNAQMKAFERERQNASKTASDVLNKTITQGLSETMQQVGFAIAGGVGAFKTFHRFLLDLLGNAAIAIGTVMVQTGIAKQLLEFALPGGAMIAAGLGLIALGSVLKSVGGGGLAEVSQAGGSTEGGGAAAAGGGLSSPPGGDFGRDATGLNKPQTSVQVVIQGNVLDRRQTGLEIDDVINEVFGSNGVTFATAGA